MKLEMLPKLPPLTPKQEAVLAYVREHPGVTHVELAAVLHRSPQAVTATIAGLIQRGLIGEQQVLFPRAKYPGYQIAYYPEVQA